MKSIFVKSLKIFGFVFLGLIIIIIVAIGIQLSNYKKLEKVEIENLSLTDTIPFTYSNSGHILIDVQVEGSRKTYPFILDSGASNIIFDNKSSEFNFENNGIGIGVGSNGNFFFSSIKKVDNIKIQSLEFKNFNAEEINHNFDCFDDAYGLIGTGLMHQLNWQIDFKNNEIIVSRDLKNLSIGNDKVELELKENPFSHHITLPIRFSKESSFSYVNVDLGNPGNLSLNENLILKDSLKLEFRKVFGTKVSGLGDSKHRTSNDKIYLADTLFFNSGFKLKNFSFSSNPNSINLLGLGLFKNYKTTISWQNKKIILEPFKNDFSFIGKTFGLNFRYDEDTQKVLISSIIEKSVAEKEGLILNSEIISVNEMNRLNKSDLCEIREIMVSNDTLNLSTKFENEINTYILIKEPLFAF